MHFSNYFQTLLTAAEAYFYLGWSVILLLGDSDSSRPKVPAIVWAAFQHYRASLQEQQKWFREGGFPCLGIATGSVSPLVIAALVCIRQNILTNLRSRHSSPETTDLLLSTGEPTAHYHRSDPTGRFCVFCILSSMDCPKTSVAVIRVPTLAMKTAFHGWWNGLLSRASLLPQQANHAGVGV